MLTEISELTGMKVYSDKGKYIGPVDDVIVDLDRQCIHGLYIESPNSQLVENGAPISIPYRWIKAVGEIILLKRFPAFVKQPDEKE
ncbi:MAG: PRC-barrel domain-containing protein [Thermoplasmataceae archaeon]